MNEPSKFQKLLQLIRELNDQELEAHRDLIDGEIERRTVLAAAARSRRLRKQGSDAGGRRRRV